MTGEFNEKQGFEVLYSVHYFNTGIGILPLFSKSEQSALKKKTKKNWLLVTFLLFKLLSQILLYITFRIVFVKKMIV